MTLRRHLLGDERDLSVTQRILPDGRPILFQDMHEEQELLPPTSVEHHPHFSRLERTMVAMQNRAAELGLEVTVLLIPTKGEVYRWILNQRERRPEDTNSSGFALAVLNACQRLQMRCLDAKPYLAQEAYRRFDSSGELLYWRDDTHLNDHGHEALASFIAREILGSVSHPPSLSGTMSSSTEAGPSD